MMLTQQDLDVLVQAGVLVSTDEPGVYRLAFNPHQHVPVKFVATSANRPPWAYCDDHPGREGRVKGPRKAVHRSRANLMLVKGTNK